MNCKTKLGMGLSSSCCKPISNIVNVLFIDPSDMKLNSEGLYVMKRKYGKFTRPLYDKEGNQYNAEIGTIPTLKSSK